MLLVAGAHNYLAFACNSDNQDLLLCRNIIRQGKLKMNEEIEDLKLEIQRIAFREDHDELYIICEKLKLDKSDFVGKSHFAIIKFLKREIENLFI